MGDTTFSARPRPKGAGCFHIDVAEAQIAKGKRYWLAAINHTFKFAFVESHAN